MIDIRNWIRYSLEKYSSRGKRTCSWRMILAMTFVITLLSIVIVGTENNVCASDMSRILADADKGSIAVPSGVVEEKDLTMDAKSYVFSNSTDGMFRLSFAEGKSYYLGCAEDSDTRVTYALIKYGSKLYLVVADDSEDNVEYNGSYTDTSFDMLASQNYNSTTRKVRLSLKYGKDIEITHFIFNKDYSVKLSGYYNGTYYTDGKAATGIFVRNGYYDYFVRGKAVIADGWYKYGSASPTGELIDADIVNSLGSAAVKYVQLFEGHVQTTYHGEKCYSYKKTVKTVVKSAKILVNNIYVEYNSKGSVLTGVVKRSGSIYYYEAGIPVKNDMRNEAKEYYYLGSDGKAVKSQWVKTGDYEFYFSDKCYATKVYYLDSFSDKNYAGKIFNYTGGAWKSTFTGIQNVNGTYYYFVKGTKYNGTKWYVKSDSCRYYVKSGVVVYTVKADGVRYRCYKVTDTGRVVLGRNIWLPSYNNLVIHTDATGLSDVIYYKKGHPVSGYADTYRVCVNNTWIKKRNTVVYIPGGYYYFDKNGKLVRTKGWQTISQTSAVYIGDKVYATSYVYYDVAEKCSIYRTGAKLGVAGSGLKKTTINGKSIYYYVSANGKCIKSTNKIVGDVEYVFNKYGQCAKKTEITWNYNAWMKRVTKAYLGKTGIYCNAFVANAFRYAGGSDPSEDMTVKYTSYSKGGFVINSSNMCSDWALRKVTAKAILSDNGDWLSAKEYNLTADRENFSYSALIPGDVIVYYTDGEPTHVGIYLGKFASASVLKKYLRSLGISASACEAYVNDWGLYSGNKPEYWVIQGGMGSSDQVYISNSAYDLSGQYAKKIIHIRH